MIETVLSLLEEGYPYVSDKKARNLYICSEFHKLDQEILFLSVLKKSGREISSRYHLALQEYVLVDVPRVCDFVATYGSDDEAELMDLRVEELTRLYQNYFYKSMRLFAVK